MKVVFSRRAIADLEGIASYYRTLADPKIAESVERRMLGVIGRISRMPVSAPRVSQRTNVRVVQVLRYPYKIFYRVREDTIDVLHIRHTARRPWKAGN